MGKNNGLLKLNKVLDVFKRENNILVNEFAEMARTEVSNGNLQGLQERLESYKKLNNHLLKQLESGINPILENKHN